MQVGVLVGPPLSEAFKQAVGAKALSFQGVNGYNADVAGYLAGGDAAGSKSMYVSSLLCRNLLALFRWTMKIAADIIQTGHPWPAKFSPSVLTLSSS